MNLDLDPRDEEWLRAETTATCPNCGLAAERARAASRRQSFSGTT